jgi:hypothetical protein
MVSRIVLAAGGRRLSACDVEVFDRCHVGAHTRGPFLYLWPNVGQKGVGRPATQYHDFVDWFVGEEEGHCCSQADGVRSDVAGGVSEKQGRFTGAGEAYQGVGSLLRDVA